MPATKKEPTERPIQFLLKGIELLDFSIINPNKILPPEIIFNFNLRIEHKILAENNFLAVVVAIDIHGDLKEPKYGSLIVSCIYEVPEMTEYINSETNMPGFPEIFMTTLNSISISTARGILFSQLRGTLLHNAILPVVDPKSFVAQ